MCLHVLAFQQTYSAFLVDAVLAFAHAARDMYANSTYSAITEQPVPCESSSSGWGDGPVMLEYLKQVETSSYLLYFVL